VTVDHSEWDARYAEHELVWGAEPNRFVVEAFEHLPSRRALDIATGEGRNAIWLAELGWQVTAVDFSPVAIERARRLADGRGLSVEWVTADVVTYQPPPRSFDAVIVAYLHLLPPQRAAVLTHAEEALVDGGLILVVGHDLTNLDGGTGGPQDPAILHTPEGIVAELSGCAVARAERAHRPVSTESGVVDAIDTVILAIKGRPTAAAP
jgi:SAM-dependent methyltransferase